MNRKEIEAAAERVRDALAAGADTTALREQLRLLQADPSPVDSDERGAAAARGASIRESAAGIAVAVRARVAKTLERHSLEG